MPKWIHALILADVRRVHRSCYSARQHIFPKKMYLYIHAYIQSSVRRALFMLVLSYMYYPFLYTTKNLSQAVLLIPAKNTDIACEGQTCGGNCKTNKIKVRLSWHLCPLVIFYLSHTIEQFPIPQISTDGNLLKATLHACVTAYV